VAKVQVHKKFLFNKGEDGGIVPFHEGTYDMDDTIANHPWSLGFLTILEPEVGEATVINVEPTSLTEDKPVKAKK